MAMLNSLVIKNFRMLEDFTVEKLGRVNLIVGKNNSGKSTVLEALRIYAGRGNPELLKNIAESRDESLSKGLYSELFTGRFFPESKDVFDSYYLPLDVDTEDEEILISQMDKKIAVYIWSTGEISFMSRGKFEEYRFHIEEDREESDDFDAYRNKFKKERVPCSFIPTQFVSMEELENEWNEINLTDNEDIVNQSLQIIAPNFKRLAFNGDKNKRWVKIRLANESKPVSLKSLGDGMLRILQIAIKLVSAQGGFLLIDEFENGLHYSVQENVWRLLFEMAEKLDIQVFATTHSWDCIESFIAVAQQKPEADAVLFRMGKSVRTSNKGQVIATIFRGEELGYITQSNMEIR